MKKKVMSNLLGLVGARKKVRCKMKKKVMSNLLGLIEAKKKSDMWDEENGDDQPDTS